MLSLVGYHCARGPMQRDKHRGLFRSGHETIESMMSCGMSPRVSPPINPAKMTRKATKVAYRSDGYATTVAALRTGQAVRFLMGQRSAGARGT